MSIKIIFDKPIKYKGKRIEAKKIIEVDEKEKKDMLECGAFILQSGIIGINKKGEKVIVEEEISSKKQKEGKKETKGKE